MGWRSVQSRVRGDGPHLRGRPPYETVRARGWRADRRCAVSCSAVFFGLALLLEWGSGELTVLRVLLPGAAAAVVLAVLWPPRVTAGQGWLAVRSLLRTRTVRTDALVGVWRIGEVSVGLVLRDVYGGRVEFVPDVVSANPLLWHLLDAGVRRSREQGTLRTGTQVLDELRERVDGQAREILRASGLR